MKTRAEIARYLSDRIDQSADWSDQDYAHGARNELFTIFLDITGAPKEDEEFRDIYDQHKAIVARLEAEEAAKTLEHWREADPFR